MAFVRSSSTKALESGGNPLKTEATKFESCDAGGGEEIYPGLQEQPDGFLPFRAGSLLVLHGAPDRILLVPSLDRLIDGAPPKICGIHRVGATVQEHADTARPTARRGIPQTRTME